MKENKEIFGATDEDLYNFVDACLSDEDGYLHIKTTALAETFVYLCKKFQGASIFQFMYTTQNASTNILYKRKNDLYLRLGVNVFLPGLRYTETYQYDITLIFTDVSELSYFPAAVNNKTEITVDTFTVSEDECIFSCHAKDDETKKFFVKAKELLVENFIDPDDEEDDDNEEEYPEDGNYSEYTELSLMDRAWALFNKKAFDDCIHLLKSEYSDLEKDPAANNLLALCYHRLKNDNEAIPYINIAIELDDKNFAFYFNKASIMSACGLPIECLKNLNIAMNYTKDEEHARDLTKTIMNYVNNHLESYGSFLLTNNNKLEEYILCFDSIINLQYCFPEYKEKYKILKSEAIDYYYKETYYKFNNDFLPGKSYDDLASRCKALLKIQGISKEQQKNVESLLESCNKIIDEDNKKNNYADNLLSQNLTEKEIIEKFTKKYPYSDYFIKDKIKESKSKN